MSSTARRLSVTRPRPYHAVPATTGTRSRFVELVAAIAGGGGSGGNAGRMHLTGSPSLRQDFATVQGQCHRESEEQHHFRHFFHPLSVICHRPTPRTSIPACPPHRVSSTDIRLSSAPQSPLGRHSAPVQSIGSSLLVRRSCRSGRGGRRASTRCCGCSTCGGCRPATCRKHLPPCWARTRPKHRKKSSELAGSVPALQATSPRR
jgi:hypothetical protein